MRVPDPLHAWSSTLQGGLLRAALGVPEPVRELLADTGDGPLPVRVYTPPRAAGLHGAGADAGLPARRGVGVRRAGLPRRRLPVPRRAGGGAGAGRGLPAGAGGALPGRPPGAAVAEVADRLVVALR